MAKERCAFCGALNPADAEWCGQCLRQFPPDSIGEAATASEPVLPPEETQLEAAPQRVREGEGVSVSRAYSVGAQSTFLVTEAGITWKCHQCETVNPLEATVCSVCGTTFAEIVRPKEERPERDPNMAAMISLFLPGAGHMYLGLWPQGIARAVVSVWVASVVLVAMIAGGKNNTTTVAVTFGLVATALWLIGAHDAFREARGEGDQVLLRGKIFLYLVLGLLMLLFFLLVSAGLSARA